MRCLPICSLAIASFVLSSSVLAQDPGAPPVVPPPSKAAPTESTTPLEQQVAATPQASSAAPTERPKGLQTQIGDFSVKLGGYIKVDLIHDFDAIGSTDSFDPRTIPTDGSDAGTNTRMHARQTRLNLDVRGPTSAGDVRLFAEGDFFGSGNAFRLRHAFGTLGPVLGGQTWTTFMDEDAMPETLDFESPIAFPLIRQAQIRLRHEFGDGSYGAIALEDPASNVIAPPVPGAITPVRPGV